MDQQQNNQTEFQALRAEIDRIDSALLDLLKRRGDAVLRLGAIKRAEGGSRADSLRPGREVAIIRRLLEDYEGPLPPDTLVGIWRSIIAAFLRLQYPFTVRVFANGGSIDLWDLARSHFGAGTPMEAASDSRAILRSIGAGEAVLGLLPAPEQLPWWIDLPLWGLNRPRVVACLPVIETPGATQGYLVAASTPEPGGDDQCWIMVRGGERDGDKIVTAAAAAGLEVSLVASYKASGATPTASHLLATDRCLGDDAPELAALARAADGGGIRGAAGVVGLFARPVARPINTKV